ncbi:SNF2-related protein [Desulfosporosinus sp. BICA1-9]|uniref:SNF2-related protein n=1 Tax=Desulfosporosinus sp. BICA1-9 TaxID=1531958 RepID=UPI00054B41EB|nr:SNF2-related protein [Desulfosporosinus sp. BICA1-9]KJS49373.1 MAG: hypothetical protein VR66_08830 [Peptococcaceae bacterium BRH_c23]KJS80659.1 MAG: hypothetical protein JL57_27840 [Desulfosporosinus sp. BICA1-9]HBW34738.1 hypothetical protein [Desulfosporosinus sp.]
MRFGLERLKSMLKANKERSLTLDYSDSSVLRIYLQENGLNISFQGADDNIHLLVNMSNASLAEDKICLVIPYENMYEFYFDEEGNPIEDYRSLNLPALFDGFIYIENNGNFVEDDRVTYNFQFKDGREHDIKRFRENIVLVDGSERLLSPEMYDCLKLVTKYNQDERLSNNIASQFELLASIKDFAERTNLALNHRLSIEGKPVIVDKIKLDFNKTPRGLEIMPVIAGKDEEFNSSFVSAFDKYAEIKNFYTVKENGKDVKVIIKNKDSAKKVKQNRLLTGEKEQDFYRGQNELLEDENFDLSEYGPRVKGLGYLNYRAVASPSNNSDESWFDFSQAYQTPSLYTDELVHPWRPEDREILQEKLVAMDRDQRNLSELELQNEGEVFKVQLTREQLIDEITKISDAFIDPSQIKSIKDLKEIKEKCEANSDQRFIEHKGRFIKNYGKQEIERQIERLTEELKRPKSKQKDPMLLIKDNLTELEHTEGKPAPQSESASIPYENPASLQINLYEHQTEGVHKLQSLYHTSSTNGFLLADDMGLGKTIQILTFQAWLKARGTISPSLIVAPTTLINIWDNEDPNQIGEIQKFFRPQTFKTYKIQGIKRDSSRELETIRRCDLVFITYESLRLNHLWLGKVHWKCIVCDEIQAVKNPKTLVSVALKAQNGDFKIACSATPIENTTEDLWNIMDFAVPGVLGSLNQFKRQFVKPIDTLRPDQNDERKTINDILVQKIGNNFLRRSKEDKLKDLPNKKVVVQLIEASDQESKRIAEINRLRQQGEPSLPLIQKLIASCGHPKIDSNIDVNRISPKDLIAESSKLAYLKEILDPIRAKNEKAIIFTMFRQMQVILFKALNYWYGIQPNILNGTLSPDKRSHMLSAYRKSNGFDVIILSPLAAGVGITLTEANHVIHYTRLWNPAKEAQATDRVYRIGQTEDVHVYYPMLSFESTSTIKFETENKYLEYFLKEKTIGKTPDEKLNRLLVKKKNMLNNFFLAAGNPKADIIEDWEEEVSNPHQLTLNNIDRLLKPSEFEAACSVLYKKLGYHTFLTVSSGDFGVDVVIEKGGKYGLIQSKMVKELTRSALDEVNGAKNIYASQLGVNIDELIVISTAERITDSIKFSAEQNKISVILQNDLEKLFTENPIFYGEVENEAKDRFSLEHLKRELVCNGETR